MVYFRIREGKHSIQEVEGTGVIIGVSWYREDPGTDPEELVSPDVSWSIVVPVPTKDYLTDELIEDALERVRPKVEQYLFGTSELPSQPAARQMFGKVFDAGQISQRVQQRREAVKGKVEQ